ncbi:MAG TPA: hypothetical protein VLG11_00050 [Candidatus Saccharimonadales bacterium]|nr:hypothetical protein [Candidatus Saccharimonadales bacterium]
MTHIFFAGIILGTIKFLIGLGVVIGLIIAFILYKIFGGKK